MAQLIWNIYVHIIALGLLAISLGLMSVSILGPINIDNYVADSKASMKLYADKHQVSCLWYYSYWVKWVQKGGHE